MWFNGLQLDTITDSTCSGIKTYCAIVNTVVGDNTLKFIDPNANINPALSDNTVLGNDYSLLLDEACVLSIPSGEVCTDFTVEKDKDKDKDNNKDKDKHLR